MEYEGVDTVVTDAEESDWLDVSYVERNYVEKTGKKIKWNFLKNKKFLIAAIAFVCVASLAVFMWADSNFRKDVFSGAKNAYTTMISIFDGGSASDAQNKINVPCNATLVEITDGVAVFEGGKVALSFIDGKISDVSENSVTVTNDSGVAICFGNLTEIFVVEGDQVDQNQLIGRYDGTFTATISDDGQAVSGVIATEREISWES